MSAERRHHRPVNSAQIPLGNGKHVVITFPQEPLTPDQWERFMKILAAMQAGLVVDVVDETLLPDAVFRLGKVAQRRAEALQAMDEQLGRTGNASVTTDLRHEADDVMCGGCGHRQDEHSRNGIRLCGQCDGCNGFDWRQR